MRKKVLALVLALVMVVAMLPTVAFAADTPTYEDGHSWNEAVAQDSKQYISGTEDGNIELSGDITLTTFVQPTGGVLTINLNGHNITRTGGATFLSISGECSVTIKGTGTVSSEGTTGTIINATGDKASLTIEGGDIKVSEQHQNSNNQIGVLIDGGTFKMTGGSITAPCEALRLQKATANATIENGTLKRTTVGSDSAQPAVCLMTGSKLEMSGGTISSVEFGIQIQDSNTKVTVTGGTIESTDPDGAAAVAVTNGSNFEMTNGTIKSACQGLSVGNTLEGDGGNGPASATIGGTAVIDCKEKSGIGEVQVGDGGTLNIQENAKITGSVAVFNQGKLNVSGGEITSKEGFAVSTNGSLSTGAQINITGGKITGTSDTCGVYLPAGELTVSGNDTVISGGAGIVVFGGTLDVKGGTIEATGTGTVEVGSSGQSVPASGIAVNTNSSYNEGKNSVTVEGGTVKAAEDQQTITYSENGSTEDKVPDGKDNKIVVSGGKFVTGESETADKSVSSYTAADTLIDDNGTPNAKLFVKAFGYGATKEEAIEGAAKASGKEKTDKWFKDWNDQTMWVVFNQKIPEGKFVIVTVTDPLGNGEIQMLCKGGSDGFAWSYLNNEQTPNTGIVSGSYSIKAEVYEGTYQDGDENTKEHATVTVEDSTLTVDAPAKPEVHPAILGDGTDKQQPTGNDTSVTAAKSSTVGDYFEVHFTTEGLQQTGKNGAEQDEKYYLGFAVEAPSGATKFEYRIGANEEALLGKQWTSQAQLEKNVTTDGKEGVAYYVEAKGSTVANPWIQIRWQDADGTIRIDTYKIVIDEISFVVAGVEEFAFVDFGFKADAAEANAAINEASKEVNPALEDDVTDAGTNTMYVVFKGKATGSTQTIYAKFTSGQNSNEGTVELTNTSNGGRMYFSFDNAEQVSQTKFAAGEYTVDLYAAENAQDSSKLLGSKSLTIYNVKFEAGEDGTFTDGAGPAAVLATKDDASKITKPAVTAPEGKMLSSWKESVDETTYTITYTAQYSTPSVSGGTTTPAATVTTPASTNGSYTVSDKNAKAGDTVTITPKADEGYTVDTVTVTDKDGKDVTVTDNGDGTYSFVMPEKASQPVTVKVTFAKVAPSAKFVDVPQTAWYAEYVDYVVANGLMEGTSDTIFSPNMTTNRAMLVTILYRLEGKPAVTKDIPFSDVAAGEWYSDAINWAAANEIVNGYGDDTFRPLRELSREEAAAILYRYAEYKEYDVTATDDLASYTDAETVSTWADTAMSWAVAEGIIKGTSETKLTPDGTAIRVQTAAMLTRFCENVAK